MEKVKFNFLKKECKEKMYGKLVEKLLKNGYKPLNNTHIQSQSHTNILIYNYQNIQ